MRHAARLARYASAAGDRRLVGRTFGGWHLEGLLGQGRFGTCYRASRIGPTPEGEPDVAALKLIKPENGSFDTNALWAEARALSLCDHPAVPRWLGIVREHDEDAAANRGRCFMVQTLMPGISLQIQLFRRKRTFDADNLAEIGAQLIGALKHLESRGVAHNDVRPANLLVDEAGRVSLVDFGLATFPERGEPVAADRAGLADVLLFLLYANPEVPRQGGAAIPWFDGLSLPSAQRNLLLDLFADEPELRDFATIGSVFEEAFAVRR